MLVCGAPVHFTCCFIFRLWIHLGWFMLLEETFRMLSLSCFVHQLSMGQTQGSGPAHWVFSCAFSVPGSGVCVCLCSGSLLTLWIVRLVVFVQLLSHVWLFVTPWTAACQGSVPFTIPWSLLRFMSIEAVLLSNHIILCCLLLLLSSIFPSIRVFSNESAFWIRWPKYWSFSFSISPSNEYSGLISFSIDWFDLLTIQGTLRSLL